MINLIKRGFYGAVSIVQGMHVQRDCYFRLMRYYDTRRINSDVAEWDYNLVRSNNYLFNVGPQSQMVAQHWTNAGLPSLFSG